jgi:DNA-binding sugar fermentation-stimulating protein
MTEKFVLQVVGITEAKILSRPSTRIGDDTVSDVVIYRENRKVLAFTPSLSCDGMSDTGSDVFVAYCPPEEDDISHLSVTGEKITHTVFLSYFKETVNNVQIMAINDKLAMEIMESAIEKNLMAILPPVKQFKRNTLMQLEGKIDSVFSFVGICEDDSQFVMEIYNVPYAEYNHGEPDAFQNAIAANRFDMTEMDYNTKSAYFPEKNNTNNAELVKKIKDLTTIASESAVRCILGYVVQRTDIDKLELSRYNDEYRLAVKKALEYGVRVMPIVISWTPTGVAFFVTDELPVVNPK